MGALLGALRDRIARLPAEAVEAGSLLKRYAAELDQPSTSNQALMRFNALAFHYKGLRDLIVPGVGEAEWGSFVDKVRRLSRAALRAKGLDTSLIGRLQRIFARSEST